MHGWLDWCSGCIVCLVILILKCKPLQCNTEMTTLVNRVYSLTTVILLSPIRSFFFLESFSVLLLLCSSSHQQSLDLGWRSNRTATERLSRPARECAWLLLHLIMGSSSRQPSGYNKQCRRFEPGQYRQYYRRSVVEIIFAIATEKGRFKPTQFWISICVPLNNSERTAMVNRLNSLLHTPVFADYNL